MPYMAVFHAFHSFDNHEIVGLLMADWSHVRVSRTISFTSFAYINVSGLLAISLCALGVTDVRCRSTRIVGYTLDAE